MFVLPDNKNGKPDEDLRVEAEEALKSVSCRPPLTKYGVAGDISVVDREEFVRRLADSKLWVYQHGRTWTAVNDEPVYANQAFGLQLDSTAFRGDYAPILANVRLNLVDDGRLPVEQDLRRRDD